MNYGFHVMSLWEHIKRRDRVESVAAVDELFQVAGERRRITRDIADSLRP
jgi:hypothetical protein